VAFTAPIFAKLRTTEINFVEVFHTVGHPDLLIYMEVMGVNLRP
jgi:hypothetical protein